MLKTIGIILILMCCTYIGFFYGENFKRRTKQLNLLLKAVLFLNNEVIYVNTPLPEALKYISFKSDDPIDSILFNASENLIHKESTSVYDEFKNQYKQNKTKFYINKDDKRVIKDFLRTLGESGVYGQDKLFNLTIENLKERVKESEEEEKKNIKMYRAVGFCIGAIISVFLI